MNYDTERFESINRELQPTPLANDFTDLEMVTRLLEAYTILGQVFQHNSTFTRELMPASTEKFLQQANYKLTQLQYKIQYQAEQEFAHRPSLYTDKVEPR